MCVKTAAILGAVLSLGPLKEEDYMRLLKQAVEPKDRLVLQAGCEHSWSCYGKPAIVFHDRGKIFTSERARQVLVDRLGISTEQAPPYAPSANVGEAYCPQFLGGRVSEWEAKAMRKRAFHNLEAGNGALFLTSWYILWYAAPGYTRVITQV